MNCQQFAAALDGYLKDKLSRNELLLAQGHVTQCEPCRTLLATEMKFQALVHSARSLGLSYESLDEMTVPDIFWSRDKRPRVAAIAERHSPDQEMPAAVIRALTGRGTDVDVLCPDGGQFDPYAGIFYAEDGKWFDLKKYNIVISKDHSGLGLAMLSFADRAGVLTINSPAAIAASRNKSDMAVRLSRAAVPCAPMLLVEKVSVLRQLPGEWFPLLLKSSHGKGGDRLRVIRRPEDLFGLHWEDDPIFAQRFLPNAGFELNLYVCGAAVFAVRKPSSITGDPKGSTQQIKASGMMIELALKVGRVFGLDVYGVDAVETAEGFRVIDVKDFPNFAGVADAADRIVGHVLSRFEAKARLTISR